MINGTRLRIVVGLKYSVISCYHHQLQSLTYGTWKMWPRSTPVDSHQTSARILKKYELLLNADQMKPFVFRQPRLLPGLKSRRKSVLGFDFSLSREYGRHSNIPSPNRRCSWIPFRVEGFLRFEDVQCSIRTTTVAGRHQTCEPSHGWRKTILRLYFSFMEGILIFHPE